MAPACKLLSLKVLDKNGKGPVSNLIAACEKIQEINRDGRNLRVHGVTMSVGCDFEPKWFACGQSPLCVEVDRLVRSGVVAAGNTGYGWNQSASEAPSLPACTSPLMIPAMPNWRSQWDRHIATCRTFTECRTSPRRDRPATAG
jgi:hypothetical protein